MSYAGFWKRFLALIVDILVFLVVGFVVGLALGLSGMGGGLEDVAADEGMNNLIGLLIGWLYFALMESSSFQGTLGKMALGIKVTDLAGNRVGFGKATVRHFSKIASTLLLLVGYIMVAFTGKKQGLHDMLAGCLVVNR